MDIFIEALRRIQCVVDVMGDGPEIRAMLHEEMVDGLRSLTEEQFFLAWMGARTRIPVPAPYGKDPPWVKAR